MCLFLLLFPLLWEVGHRGSCCDLCHRHSRILAWRIPGTGKPGGLLSMGSHRVGHDWSDLAAAAAADSLLKHYLPLNKSILKEINPGYSLEGLTLKLKLQYFGHLMERADSLKRPWCWERLKAGGEGDDRGWDGWMESPTRWTWVWVSSTRCWRTGKPGVLQSMGSQRVEHNWVTELTLSTS